MFDKLSLPLVTICFGDEKTCFFYVNKMSVNIKTKTVNIYEAIQSDQCLVTNYRYNIMLT